MLIFRRYWISAVAIAGIEVLHGIKSDRFNLSRLRLKDRRPPAACQAVLVV
jgi:hypothetical protein